MNLRITLELTQPLKLIGLPSCVTGSYQQKRYGARHAAKPKYRAPYWHLQKESNIDNHLLTCKNKEFLDDYVKTQYVLDCQEKMSPLRNETLPKGEWFPGCLRSGVIAVNLGILPQWLKNGRLIWTTLLKVADNHVIHYVPPGAYEDLRPYAKRYVRWVRELGNLVVGAMSIDPQVITPEYAAIFAKAGVMPKKILTKFPVHPEAIIQPGTPLYAAHYKVGDYVDVCGLTIDRGFQGVMKRWKFRGMPASHGQTKTHRRPGCIGGGGEKARVWPGKKMPGHMGNKHRTVRGLPIVRINHKHNILYVTGVIPGAINSVVYVNDCYLNKKARTTAPPFPTYDPEDSTDSLPDEEFHESLFCFDDPTIMYEPEKIVKGKK